MIDGSAENGAALEPFQNTHGVAYLDQDVEPSANLPKVDKCSSEEQLNAARLLPPPPADIPEEMHGEWTAIIADLQKRRLLNDSMLGVVRSYVMAQWTATQAEKSIAAQGVFVAGAGGAMKPNPATGLLRSSRDMISRLAGELGLTPTSRARKSLRNACQDGPDLFGNKWDL